MCIIDLHPHLLPITSSLPLPLSHASQPQTTPHVSLYLIPIGVSSQDSAHNIAGCSELSAYVSHLPPSLEYELQVKHFVLFAAHLTYRHHRTYIEAIEKINMLAKDFSVSLGPARWLSR